MLGSASASAKTIQRYREGDWTVAIRHDSFAAQVRCTLQEKHRRLVYQPHAVGFRLGRSFKTTDIAYRVDGGEAVRWQDRVPQLIASGVQIDGPALDNPTAGIVWLPIEEVRDSRVVAIRAAAGGKVHRFQMRGFAAMFDAARRLGCASDASFAV